MIRLIDHLGTIFWLAISIIVCIDSGRVSIGTFHSPGPGFFPFWSGIMLGSFAIISVVGSHLKRKEEEEIRQLWTGIKWNKAILVVASLLIYIILMPLIGYLITTFGWLSFLFSIIGRTRLWVRIIIAMVTSFITYVLFYIWLNVQLPKGIFG